MVHAGHAAAGALYLIAARITRDGRRTLHAPVAAASVKKKTTAKEGRGVGRGGGGGGGNEKEEGNKGNKTRVSAAHALNSRDSAAAGGWLGQAAPALLPTDGENTRRSAFPPRSRHTCTCPGASARSGAAPLPPKISGPYLGPSPPPHLFSRQLLLPLPLPDLLDDHGKLM